MITQQEQNIVFECLDAAQCNKSLSRLAEYCSETDFISSDLLLQTVLEITNELNADIDRIRRLTFLNQTQLGLCS